MLHTIFLVLALLASPLVLQADDKDKIRLTGGLEWGYSLSSTVYSHYNFLASSGIRVDIKDNSINADSNGYIDAYLGGKFLRKYAVTLRGGWYGVQSDRRTAIVSARAYYYFKDYLSDSVIMFLEGGTGLASTLEDERMYIAKLGGAYQFHLSGWMNLFLSLSLQAVEDHPASFYDSIGKASVTSPDLLRSDAWYAAVNFTVGLDF